MFSAIQRIYGSSVFDSDDSAVPTPAAPPSQPAPDHLEFIGIDSSECENLISAVSRQALAVDRQTADQWMADFAGSCFTKGALRWLDGLDEGTKSSWRALRKAMLSRYRPLFHGKSGEEAEEFLRTIHDRAINANQVGQSQWYCQIFGSSLAGEPLRWYASQSQAVQNNWQRLQRASLARYVRGETSLGPANVPLANFPFQRGRVLVVIPSKPLICYASRSFDGELTMNLTQNLAEFLIVEYNPSFFGRQSLRIPDGQIMGSDVLAIECLSEPTDDHRYATPYP
ncbi:hypothetical protein FRB90_009191 [Tulasnella sp. 427]|nr:hypothetical protein FRB90_009191 [Tulasnella sp. 427]